MNSQNHKHDQEIDNLLAALNQIQPNPGMETRILEHLDRRSEARATSSWRKWMPHFATAFAATAIIAAIALPHHHPTQPTVAHSTPSTSPKPAPSPQPTLLVASAPLHPSAGQAYIRRTIAVQPNPPTPQPSVTPASFPAPPMPLTQQEQLLLRIAHRGEQAPVTPPPAVALGTEIAELRAETDKFFQDPNTGENQWEKIVAQQAVKK